MLPPLYVYAEKKKQDISQPDRCLSAYMTNLRQHFVTNVNIPNNSTESVPYLVFDCENDGQYSRRLYRPVLSNVIPNFASSSLKIDNEQSPNLSVAGASLKQTLSKSNQTLQQIREASAEAIKTPESQLSYKPMTPNAPPLPADLQKSFSRSKQI